MPEEIKIDRFDHKWYGQGDHAYQRFEIVKDGTYIKYKDHEKIIEDITKELEQLKTGKTIGSLHNQIVNLEVKLMAQANEIERLTKPKRSRLDPGFDSEN